MATTPTAKLGIPLPVAGSGEPFTVAAYNFGVTTLDGAAGATVVTSSSRPGSPFSGQVIFETDTFKSFVWSGSAWVGTTGFTVCTSTTRPSVPWLGQPIFETDTLKSFVWDGSAWKVLGGGAGGGFDSVFLLMGA